MANPVLFINTNASLNRTQKKKGTLAEYKRVTSVDFFEPVKKTCQRVLDYGNVYLSIEHMLITTVLLFFFL